MNILMHTTSFMKNWWTKTTKKIYPYFLIFLIVIQIVGCRDEGTDFGSTVLPDNRQFEMFRYDSFTFQFKTVETNPAYTKGIDTLVVGTKYNDVFGKTTASFIVGLNQRPDGANAIYVGDSVKFTEAVLRLALVNNNNAQFVPSISVYSLTERPDENYYISDANINNIKGEYLNKENSYIPNNSDTIVIPLKDEFVEKLKNHVENDSLKFKETLWEDYPGLLVTTEEQSTANAMARINAKSPGTELIINLEFYVKRQAVKDDDEAKADSLVYKSIAFDFHEDHRELAYTFGKDEQGNDSLIAVSVKNVYPVFRANYINHDYTGTNMPGFINQAGNDKLYINSFAGLHGEISINGLDIFQENIGDRRVIVNKALLTIPYSNADNDQIVVPQSLMLSHTDGQLLETDLNLNSEPQVITLLTQNLAYQNQSNLTYEFEIARYIQEFINSNLDNKPFKIFVPDLYGLTYNRFLVDSVAPTRTHVNSVILKNDTSNSQSVSLQVYYQFIEQ